MALLKRNDLMFVGNSGPVARKATQQINAVYNERSHYIDWDSLFVPNNDDYNGIAVSVGAAPNPRIAPRDLVWMPGGQVGIESPINRYPFFCFHERHSDGATRGVHLMGSANGVNGWATTHIGASDDGVLVFTGGVGTPADSGFFYGAANWSWGAQVDVKATDVFELDGSDYKYYGVFNLANSGGTAIVTDDPSGANFVSQICGSNDLVNWVNVGPMTEDAVDDFVSTTPTDWNGHFLGLTALRVLKDYDGSTTLTVGDVTAKPGLAWTEAPFFGLGIFAADDGFGAIVPTYYVGAVYSLDGIDWKLVVNYPVMFPGDMFPCIMPSDIVIPEGVGYEAGQVGYALCTIDGIGAGTNFPYAGGRLAVAKTVDGVTWFIEEICAVGAVETFDPISDTWVAAPTNFGAPTRNASIGSAVAVFDPRRYFVNRARVTMLWCEGATGRVNEALMAGLITT